MKSYCSLSLSLLLLLLFSCTKGIQWKGIQWLEGEARQIRYGNLFLSFKADLLPDFLPASFAYPKAKKLWSIVYRNDPFFQSGEGAVLMESKDKKEAMIAYYSRQARLLSWKLIQSQQFADRHLLMLESPSRRLLSIIITPPKAPAQGQEEQLSQIKLYSRRAPIF